jgi:hypothetical protein
MRSSAGRRCQAAARVSDEQAVAEKLKFMASIQITPLNYGTRGEVVAVEDGMIVWTGPIDAVAEAGSFDALFCHDDDEEQLKRLAREAGFDVPNRAT